MKTEHNVLNLSLYDHLDNASIVKWIEEFTKRNDDFQTDYEELNRLALSGKSKDNLKLWALWDKMTEKYGFIPVIKRTHLYPDLDMAKRGSVGLPLQAVTVHDKISENVWSQLRPDGTRGDMIRLTVNLLYTNEEIINSLSDILEKKRKASSCKVNRKRTSEWKLYLMVFDFKTENQNLTYDEISYILHQNGIEKAISTKNVENYYKKAVKLINGGYKTFLQKTFLK